LQVSSGAATGLAWSTATYPATASNVARILRSDGTNWIETTSTFADTYAASGFLYANGANNVAGLATANNGLPVTGNTGVPVMLAGPAATGRVLTSNTAAAPFLVNINFPIGGWNRWKYFHLGWHQLHSVHFTLAKHCRKCGKNIEIGRYYKCLYNSNIPDNGRIFWEMS
jgi:hypothetical protein